MARVVILTRTYYPAELPITFRVASFARWLPDCGHSVRVIAPEWNRASTRSNPYLAGALADAIPDERKAEIVFFPASPSVYNDWRGKYPALQPFTGNPDLIRKMVEAGKQLYQREPFDVILATAPPFVSMLKAADQLSRELGVPWVADMRDISGQFPEKREAGLFGAAVSLVRRLTRVRERWIAAETLFCNRAFVTTTVSDSLADMLRMQGVRRVEVILNGYEEAHFKVPPIAGSKFAVQYFGTFNVYFEITPLFDALDKLLHDEKIDPADFEVVFWGSQVASFVEPLVSSRLCRKVVKAKSHIPKTEANARMKGSQVLLHLSYRGTKGLFTSKLMEYFAAGAPILSVPGDGDVVDHFLRDTGAGVSLDDPGAIAEFLLKHYQAWKRGETIANSVDPGIKEFYTRRKQAEKMARLLDEAIADNQGR